jgi:hypothetical protein
MGIDGISGPKGIGQAPKVDDIVRADAVEATEAAARVDEVVAPEAVEAPPEAGAVEVVEAAERVAAELRVGAVQDVDHAVEVMLERLVESRYGNLSAGQQQAFTEHLRALAQNDPVFGEQLRQMVEAAV